MRLSRFSFLILCSLAGVGQAQQASYAFFGNRSGVDFGQHLAVTGTPRLGTTFTVSVAYAAQSGGCATVMTPCGC